MIANFYEISLEFENFQVQRLSYSEELLKSLRQNYKRTHGFFRSGEFIYLCPFEDNTDLIGDVVSLEVKNGNSVIGGLIRHIVYRSFVNKYPDITPTSFYPLKFKSRNPRHDLASPLLPNFLQGIITYKKQTEIQIRKIKSKDCLKWGSIINNTYRWEFNIDCFSLHSEGHDLLGSEVLHRNKRLLESGDFVNDFFLIGKIERIYNGLAVVKTNLGIKEIKLTDLRLRRSKDEIKRYLAFKIGSAKTNLFFNSILDREVNRLDQSVNLQDLNATAKVFSELSYQNSDGFSFSINARPLEQIPDVVQTAPTFIFSYDGHKTNARPDEGINQYGPYDDSTFSIKKPRILVICHRNNRGTFSNFLGKFKNGLPTSKYFKNGFVDKYRLQDVEFIFAELNDYSVSSYQEAVELAIRKNVDFAFDLAVLETKLDWKSFPTQNNPYYHISSYLFGLGIPIQWITNDNARKAEEHIDSILNSVALQVYAKLGGTPWVLPANQSIDRELVIGIGSSTIKSNNFRDPEQQRLVALTTFFSSDGRYLFGNKSRDISRERYFEELLASLNTSIQEISNRDGWRNGETIRIVFHIFKTVTNQEASVVKELMKLYSNFEIKFAFVTVSDDHPFWLFDPSELGVKTNYSTKGRFIPKRGQTLLLNDYSCLIQMKGAFQLKSNKQAASRALLVTIHKESTFNDLYYISQQAFRFSFLSWRGFFPIQQPVTIYYSDLIAEKLAHLREISTWKPEVINLSLKFKKWFL